MVHRFKSCMRTNLLTILTVLGVFCGVALGWTLQATLPKWTPRQLMYLQFPGDIFLRMLKALIIPLLVSSVVYAIGSLDLSVSRKIVFRSIFFYVLTTLLAIILSIILVLAIKPGKRAAARYKDCIVSREATRHVLTQDTLLDLARNLFPPNLVQAAIYQSQTKLIQPNDTRIPLENWKFVEEYGGTTNVLGLVIFSIVLGISLSVIGHKGKPIVIFFQTLSEAMLVVTSWVIWISPIGVLFLIAAKTMQTESLAELAGKLGLYFVTVIAGLIVHGFVTLPIIYFIFTRTLPFRTLGKLSQVLITAFGTSSSAATMPVTLQTLDRMGVDPRVTRFVIPVGATINMDGTALYESVAAIFIAQFRSVHLTFGQVCAISVTATAASVGAAGIPQAGLVTMVMVLDTVGLPAEDVSLILTVDWLLDRFRTTINVMCDCLVAKMVESISKNELRLLSNLNQSIAEPELVVGNEKSLPEIEEEPTNTYFF